VVEKPGDASITLSRNVLVLALDTTTRSGSIAVVRGTDVVAEFVGDGAVTHGARLPGDLIRALDIAGATLDDVEMLAVAAGPGSFTGMRVGIAAMQGLAMARDLRIVPVSVLDALAVAGRNGASRVAAWMDGQRGEVFAALYEPSGQQLAIAATALTPERTLDSWAGAVTGGPVVFIGDGAVKYEAALHARLGSGVTVVAPPPLAPVIGRIAAADPSRAQLPHAVVPIYVRRPDAELARTRSSG
jgi:tRNA threonylcarbamoyladenosine biosynthesis protein TsaB